MKSTNVIIIGAGAAGLMCAIKAGERGRKVLVLDHANKPGKKILMSGGGRCNFTNLHVSHENFISHNPQFCKSALSRYTPWDFIALVEKHKIPFHEKTLGQLFCDHKSKDILNMLLDECAKVSAEIKMHAVIQSVIQLDNKHLKITTNDGIFQCESLVIASGGLSIPTMGAGPFGYKIAEQFGIKVWPTRAGLVPFTLQNHDKETLSTLSGVSQNCVVSCNNQSFREGMLFTHRGLSGPAMLQISSYWQPGDMLNVNFLPDINLFEHLKSEQKHRPNIQLKNLLNECLPKRQVMTWVDESLANQTLASLSYQKLKNIADLFQQWQIKPNGTEGYRTAEVTLGGVDCDAISSKTFQANQVPGLYFIGEVLDVTGWLGGYNFQWAWASGAAAGGVV